MPDLIRQLLKLVLTKPRLKWDFLLIHFTLSDSASSVEKFGAGTLIMNKTFSHTAEIESLITSDNPGETSSGIF